MPECRLDPDKPLLLYKRINMDTTEVHLSCTRQTQRKNYQRETSAGGQSMTARSEKKDKMGTVDVSFLFPKPNTMA